MLVCFVAHLFGLQVSSCTQKDQFSFDNLRHLWFTCDFRFLTIGEVHRKAFRLRNALIDDRNRTRTFVFESRRLHSTDKI